MTTTTTTTAANSNTPINSLELIKQELCRRTNNPDFNVNSPKQVSLAIFGKQQTCTTKVLQDAAMDLSLAAHQRELALLILKCKKLMQQKQHQRKEEDLPAYEGPLSSSASAKVSSLQSILPTAAAAPSPRKRRPHTQQAMIQSHEQIVETLFASPKCKLDPYWKQPLLELSRPVARDLLVQLNTAICPVAFDPEASPKRSSAMFATTTTPHPSRTSPSASTAGRKGTFLAFVRQQKETYPQCVMLVRCGDFYETYGTDAILLMEHVGLNSMGGKVKAGCPYRNIQSTLDGLTQHGFSVAVFEEMGQVVSSGKGGSSKLKDRILTQIVSPASPTYLYDNWLLEGSNGVSGANPGSRNPQSLDGLPPSRPCVGVIHTAAGYNMVEVSLEERSVQYSERLTAEAVVCRLAAYPPADPLVYVPTPFEQKEASTKGMTPVPSFLPNPRSRVTNGDRGVVESHLGGYRLRTKVLSPGLIAAADAGRSDSDRYVQTVVETFLDINERQLSTSKQDRDNALFKHQLQREATAADFTVAMTTAATNPLYVETATQLGLMNDKTIPSLIQFVLDGAAPIAARRFLQRYLLIPPPPTVAQSMASLVRALMSPEHAGSLPPLMVPNLGKVLSLIRAGQAGANVYGELLQSLATTTFVLQENDEEGDGDDIPIQDLLHLCQHESGLPAERHSLLDRCRSAISTIEEVVSTSYHVQEDFFDEGLQDTGDMVTQDGYIPDSFFDRNELTWRGRIQPNVASDAYRQVHLAAQQLCQAVKTDFISESVSSRKNEIVHSINDNLVALKSMPDKPVNKDSYFHPRDRNGKLLRTRWTTQKVEDALSTYVGACENAQNEVASVLSNLAVSLQDEGHVPAIVQSAHFNLILSVAFHHSAKATRSNWQLASTVEDSHKEVSDTNGAHFADVFPYWMDQTTAVSNTFDLSSMILLTAPNMSGKSTLMRSTAAAALLTICGLCAPLAAGSKIPRFDTLFLRGASADIPTEDKSAFGAEMGDLSALFRSCGSKSMVFVDELARGTSPYDGTRLAGAVLEAMAERGMSGFFATHLHDIIDLNLRGRDRIALKRMAILHDGRDARHNAESYEWTYQLEDGVCTDSLALVTAERFGLPDDILLRADELGEELDNLHPVRFAERTNEPEDVNGPMESVSRQRRTQSSAKAIEFREQFQEVVDMGVQLLSDTKPVAIPPLYLPPPNLCNQSCLYVLQLTKDPPSYYVGETDDLPQRLKQHRKKGAEWKRSRAFAFPVEDKSSARYFESILIRQLAQSGYRLESTTDGRSARQRLGTPKK
ncbi:MAG: hypothetical protein SGILL_005645 [Bacillariaceae sp.]